MPRGVPHASGRCCSPAAPHVLCLAAPLTAGGHSLATAGLVCGGLMARGVPRCERYGVVPLARMVQQSQYLYSLPVEQAGSPATQPRGKGRKPSRAGRKRLRQGLGQNPRRHRSQGPAAVQQPWGPGTLSPVFTRGKAEPTTRHPAAQWGLEPSPSTAMTVLEQDLAGGKRAPGGAQQGAAGSAHPACTARPEGGSIGSSLAGEELRTTPVPAPAVEGRRQQGEWVLGAECVPQLGSPKARWGRPSLPPCPQAQAGCAGATSAWISVSTRSCPTR